MTHITMILVLIAAIAVGVEHNWNTAANAKVSSSKVYVAPPPLPVPAAEYRERRQELKTQRDIMHKRNAKEIERIINELIARKVQREADELGKFHEQQVKKHYDKNGFVLIKPPVIIHRRTDIHPQNTGAK